jgi:hypothetical protein
MVYPPGQGKSGRHLMHLWRRYLEQYAENEGDPQQQIVIAACHSAEIFGSLSEILDREGKSSAIIEQRTELFREGTRRAQTFEDRLVNAAFTLYNHFNTLSHQFTVGNPDAETLIKEIDDQVRIKTQDAGRVERSASALLSAFPLLSLMTLVLDQEGSMTDAIRQIEQRFAAASSISSKPWEHLVNALYRIVEMMQVMVILSDPDLRGQVDQIAARFQEEDQAADPTLKARNGFCRLFELTHLLTTHLDEIL